MTDASEPILRRRVSERKLRNVNCAEGLGHGRPDVAGARMRRSDVTFRFHEGFGHSSEAAELDPSAKQFTGLFRAPQQW